MGIQRQQLTQVVRSGWLLVMAELNLKGYLKDTFLPRGKKLGERVFLGEGAARAKAQRQ